MNDIKVFVLNNNTQNGLNTIEGYIEYEKYSNIYRNYFKLEYDFDSNNYDYSESDITENQENLLHKILNDGKFNCILDEEHLYNYLKCVISKDNYYISNKGIKVGLNNFTIKVWENSKGFLHFIKKEYSLFNIGKRILCDVEYAFNKKRKLKEIGYNIIEY